MGYCPREQHGDPSLPAASRRRGPASRIEHVSGVQETRTPPKPREPDSVLIPPGATKDSDVDRVWAKTAGAASAHSRQHTRPTAVTQPVGRRQRSQ